MNRPIIGIIGRKAKIDSIIDRYGNVVLYDYMSALDREGASYFGLITNDNYDLIDENIIKLCDGILMTGGIEIKDYHMAIIRYAIENGIPFLGVCQGAQALGLATLTGAKLENLDQTKPSHVHAPDLKDARDLLITVHKVNFKQRSLLYKLFGKSIEVNSNHHYAIPMVDKPMKVAGLSDDGVIEAIEHIDSNVFAVGVQWHPEVLDSMQPLFKEFVDSARRRRK